MAQAQAPEQFAAVPVHQPQVQQHRVKTLGAQGAPGAGDAITDIHRIAALLQVAAQATGYARIVFDHEYSHAGIVAARQTRAGR